MTNSFLTAYYLTIPPLSPTWARYFKIFWLRRNISVHRALEYEALEGIDWDGDILDIGGGASAHYGDILRRNSKMSDYQSVNMDSSMSPTYLEDLSGDFKLPSRKYDMVISLNTMEHLRHPEKVLVRIPEVLVPGGRLVVIVPFLIRVHASPHDYLRLTASWWGETLAELGFKDIVIEPLVWDPISSASAVSLEVGPFRLIRRLIIPLYGLLYAAIRCTDGRRYPAGIGEKVGEFALAYLIKARFH